MKFLSLFLILAVSALSATGHAESVYKLKDDSGATVYSDRPNLQGTTNTGTVEIAPGPSPEQQQAAERKVQQMEKKSHEMRQNRLNNEKRRPEAQANGSTATEEIESSGVGVIDNNRRHNLKTRIPTESPDGGEHPIYEPGKERPVHPAPRPGRRVGR